MFLGSYFMEISHFNTEDEILLSRVIVTQNVPFMVTPQEVSNQQTFDVELF